MTIIRTAPFACYVGAWLAFGVLVEIPSFAEDPTDTGSSENTILEIERLTALLDARSLAQRQAAEQALIEMGPGILELLPRENDLPTAEMRQRVRRIRKQLESMESATSVDVTGVTIKQARTLGDALGQITRQTRMKFKGGIETTTEINVDVKNVPLWTAIDEVLDAADLDVNLFAGEEMTLALVPRDEDRPRRSDHAAYSGVFRIEPTGVVARRSLHNPKLSGLDLMIDIAWEPRLTPIGLSLPLKEVGVKLDDGSELELQISAETSEAMPNPGVPATQASIPFQLPAGQPAEIDTLTGKIDALLPGVVKKFEFDLGRSSFKPKDAGEVTVHLERLSKNGELHEIRVAVKFKNPDRSLESHRGWIFDNPAFVVRRDESKTEKPIGEIPPKAIEHLGYEMYRQTSDEIGIGYLFDLNGDPSKYQFRYETPSSIIRSEVRFTLHDIPLP